MILEAVEKAIINQIKNEEHSSRLYLAMASWCQVQGFPGAAAFLYKQTDEERMHQLKFVHYLNDRAGYSKLLALDNPTSEYKSLLDVFEKVLAHEEFITASINNLYEIALNNKDYTTGNFLQWFINEQIEEESTVHNILDKMKLAGNESGGLFLIDKELSALAAAKVVATLTTT
jgi:ferritin